MPTSFHKDLEVAYNKSHSNQIFKWKKKTRIKEKCIKMSNIKNNKIALFRLQIFL